MDCDYIYSFGEILEDFAFCKCIAKVANVLKYDMGNMDSDMTDSYIARMLSCEEKMQFAGTSELQKILETCDIQVDDLDMERVETSLCFAFKGILYSKLYELINQGHFDRNGLFTNKVGGTDGGGYDADLLVEMFDKACRLSEICRMERRTNCMLKRGVFPVDDDPVNIQTALNEIVTWKTQVIISMALYYCNFEYKPNYVDNTMHLDELQHMMCHGVPMGSKVYESRWCDARTVGLENIFKKGSRWVKQLVNNLKKTICSTDEEDLMLMYKIQVGSFFLENEHQSSLESMVNSRNLTDLEDVMTIYDMLGMYIPGFSKMDKETTLQAFTKRLIEYTIYNVFILPGMDKYNGSSEFSLQEYVKQTVQFNSYTDEKLIRLNRQIKMGSSREIFIESAQRFFNGEHFFYLSADVPRILENEGPVLCFAGKYLLIKELIRIWGNEHRRALANPLAPQDSGNVLDVCSIQGLFNSMSITYKLLAKELLISEGIAAPTVPLVNARAMAIYQPPVATFSSNSVLTRIVTLNSLEPVVYGPPFVVDIVKPDGCAKVPDISQSPKIQNLPLLMDLRVLNFLWELINKETTICSSQRDKLNEILEPLVVYDRAARNPMDLYHSLSSRTRSGVQTVLKKLYDLSENQESVANTALYDDTPAGVVKPVCTKSGFEGMWECWQTLLKKTKDVRDNFVAMGEEGQRFLMCLPLKSAKHPHPQLPRGYSTVPERLQLCLRKICDIATNQNIDAIVKFQNDAEAKRLTSILLQEYMQWGNLIRYTVHYYCEVFLIYIPESQVWLPEETA